MDGILASGVYEGMTVPRPILIGCFVKWHHQASKTLSLDLCPDFMEVAVRQTITYFTNLPSIFIVRLH